MPSETKKIPHVDPSVLSRIKVSVQTRTAEAVLYTRALGSIGAQGEVVRAVGRLAASVAGAVYRGRIFNTLMSTAHGREYITRFLKDVAVSVNPANKDKIERAFQDLSKAGADKKAFLETLRDKLASTLGEGAEKALKTCKMALAALETQDVLAKGKGKVALVDTLSMKIIEIDKKSGASEELIIRKEDVARWLTDKIMLENPGISKEEAQRKASEIMSDKNTSKTAALMYAKHVLMEKGYKVSKHFVADVKLSEIKYRALVDSLVNGTDYNKTMEEMLKNALATDPLFAAEYKEKAIDELRRSMRYGVFLEGTFGTINTVSFALSRAANRLAYALSRVLPVMGPLAAVAGDIGETVSIVGQSVVETVDKLGKGSAKMDQNLKKILGNTEQEVMLTAMQSSKSLSTTTPELSLKVLGGEKPADKHQGSSTAPEKPAPPAQQQLGEQEPAGQQPAGQGGGP